MLGDRNAISLPIHVAVTTVFICSYFLEKRVSLSDQAYCSVVAWQYLVGMEWWWWLSRMVCMCRRNMAWIKLHKQEICFDCNFALLRWSFYSLKLIVAKSVNLQLTKPFWSTVVCFTVNFGKTLSPTENRTRCFLCWCLGPTHNMYTVGDVSLSLLSHFIPFA